VRRRYAQGKSVGVSVEPDAGATTSARSHLTYDMGGELRHTMYHLMQREKGRVGVVSLAARNSHPRAELAADIDATLASLRPLKRVATPVGDTAPANHRASGITGGNRSVEGDEELVDHSPRTGRTARQRSRR